MACVIPVAVQSPRNSSEANFLLFVRVDYRPRKLDFSILNEFITHVLSSKSNLIGSSNFVVPDFHEKIEFDGLSDWVNR